MAKVRVVADPFPEFAAPEFVKDAFIGLPLEPVLTFQPGEHEGLPLGAHLVTVSHFVTQLKAHNPDALVWHLAKWKLSEEDLLVAGRAILMDFPYNSCRLLQ